MFQGSKGYIYTLSKLKYDHYNISDELNYEFMHSTYEDNIEDKKHNKLYIFEDVNLNKYKYEKILRTIISSKERNYLQVGAFI